MSGFRKVSPPGGRKCDRGQTNQACQNWHKFCAGFTGLSRSGVICTDWGPLQHVLGVRMT
eukprot:6069846-Karenia_brevis.AAC.1